MMEDIWATFNRFLPEYKLQGNDQQSWKHLPQGESVGMTKHHDQQLRGRNRISWGWEWGIPPDLSYPRYFHEVLDYHSAPQACSMWLLRAPPQQDIPPHLVERKAHRPNPRQQWFHDNFESPLACLVYYIHIPNWHADEILRPNPVHHGIHKSSYDEHISRFQVSKRVDSRSYGASQAFREVWSLYTNRECASEVEPHCWRPLSISEPWVAFAWTWKSHINEWLFVLVVPLQDREGPSRFAGLLNCRTSANGMYRSEIT